MPATLYRKGLDLKHLVADELSRDYHSDLVTRMRGTDGRHAEGRLTIHLPREFGFCYGVDRAVDYAYQTRRRFPDRTVYLTGEIIHNSHVNDRLREAGVRFLSDPGERLEDVGAQDVVILPAFGVTVSDLERLDRRGCTLVDTTCGSVLNVWKNVRKYARDGYTAVIHGKARHEETRATASQVRAAGGGAFLIVLDRDEAAEVCEYIAGRGDQKRFVDRFGDACSAGFDPDRDLRRVGLANQTTMLMSESLAIGEMFRQAMTNRYGGASLEAHYRAFDTICSATQDRQDAVRVLLGEREFDLVIVIGGYNSSNTRNLARICAERAPSYHIAGPSCLVSRDRIRHLPSPNGVAGRQREVAADGWLPPTGPLAVAVTAGASTPDSIVGQVVSRLAELAGDS
ncbi:MAG: 4-hydroxy-3-methylbut-2-enyl diphosphate reductase [Acidobacteria bacterium]|nr:4-hydroxy-3-methylbut-2-enyl diphosphate reductase [Acidobacteriota bacterium]